MRDQKDLITMKKAVNKIENHRENWYKLSLELNVIETNRFFVQKERVNKIELGITRDPMG